jgi:hypothetical protein
MKQKRMGKNFIYIIKSSSFGKRTIRFNDKVFMINGKARTLQRKAAKGEMGPL